MTAAPGWGLALRLARREWRGGVGRFRVFLACLALGVAAIATVGSLTESFRAGLALQARSILGGDVDVTLTQRDLTAQERAWLLAQGRVSAVIEMRAMARGLKSDLRNLVELKIPDAAYPLYGTVEVEGGESLAAALARRGEHWGAVVDPKVLSRLGVRLGDLVRLGTLDVEIRGIVAHEPDRMSVRGFLAPRVFVAAPALEASGLVQVGSRLTYRYRLLLPDGDASAFRAEATRLFPASPWRIRDPSEGVSGARTFVDRVSLFLTLVGLTALFIGGIGVGNAIRAYLESKREVIAILKCLGASGGLVFRLYLVQVMGMALVGVFLGLIAGALIPVLVSRLLVGVLPVADPYGIYPAALATAALYGGLTTLAFAVWPIARAIELPPAGLFRDIVAPMRRRPRSAYVMATAVVVSILIAMAIALTPYRLLAALFLAGAVAAFGLLRLEACALMALARAVGRPRHAGLRLALANLYRPGAPTTSVVISLGLGLTLLSGISLIDGNISRQISDELPKRVPSFFMMDIRRDQAQPLDALVASFASATDYRRVPIVRASIVEVNGVPATEVTVGPGSRWVLEEERNITYAEEVPDNSAVVAGTWWPPDYSGPPALSLGARIARDLGVGVGDSLTFNIVGRQIRARIMNLREVDFTQGGMNFAIIFAPGSLERAPQQHLATVRVSSQEEEAFQKAVSDAFANVSVIWVRETFEAVKGLLATLGMAVRATSAVTLLAGLLVLAGALASGHRQRVYDAVVLKVLGAERRRILSAYLLEFVLLGLGTAVVAAVVGLLAAYLVVTHLWEAEWYFLPLTLAATVLGATCVTAFLGFLGTWRALAQKPAPVLRAP